MGTQGYHYGLGLRTMLFSAELTSDESSVPSPVIVCEGQNVVKSGLVLTLRNGLHRQNSLQMMQQKGGNPWTESPLHVNLTMCRDGTASLAAGTIKHCNIYSTSTANMRREKPIVDVMKAMVSYERQWSHRAVSYDITFRPSFLSDWQVQ